MNHDFWNIKDLQYPSESFDIVESQCRSLQITLDTTNVIQWPPDFRKDNLGTTSPTEPSHIVEVISQQAIAVVTPRERSFLWCNSSMISIDFKPFVAASFIPKQQVGQNCNHANHGVLATKSRAGKRNRSMKFSPA